MTFSTLLSTEELSTHMHDPEWVIVDCRFELSIPDRGHDQYLVGHIPGAVYAHQNKDLAGEVTSQTGRHPLPESNAFIQRLSDWGIGPQTQVIAYDESDGSKAARLWWLLQYYGHTRAAVLDGGLAAWIQSGFAMQSREEHNLPATFSGEPHPEMVADLACVELARQDPDWLVIDARTPERYSGAIEWVDPVAGRIPGSINYYFGNCVLPDGRFKPAEELRQEFVALVGKRPMEHVIVYCGSGVTACSNLLAFEYTGLRGARLYPGSWSEWIRNPANLVATG
jgi:thiosulfate/3-mercaptopyruvate sulfurtransferase